MERKWSITQENLVSHLTWLVLTATFLKTSKLREWSIDQGNLLCETARTHRLGLFLKSKDRQLSRNIAKKSSSSRRRRAPTPTRTSMATEIGISWSSSTQSYRNGRITEIPEFYLRYDRETKTYRGSEHYFGIIRQSTGTAKWRKLYERFWGFSGCWISSQWKFPRYQSTSVIPTSSDAWRNVATVFRIAEPQRRAAKHLGRTWYIGKRFCRSTCIFISSLSSRITSMEFVRRAAPFINSGEKWKARTKSRFEMPVRTVSQRFSHLQWMRLLKELWGRPTTTADFRSSFWQIHHVSNVRLLEDKSQDWGMYLLTSSYGSYAVDQRSGDGLISGWCQFFVFCKRNSNTRLWSTRGEDCFSTEPNHP